jgi:predicted nucleotidyltransferase
MPEQHTFDSFMKVSCLLEDTLSQKVEAGFLGSLNPHIGAHIANEVESAPLAV